MARVTASGVLAVALLLSAAGVSIALAPIWQRARRVRDTTGPAWWRRVAAGLKRGWWHRSATHWGPVGAGALCALCASSVGPVVAAVLAAYGAAGFVLVRGMAVRRSEQRAYRMAADVVLTFAADLRAGQPLAPAWQAAQESLHRAESLVLPGWRDTHGGAVAESTRPATTAIAERSGAPLADVLDRLDAHLRAVDRARAVASGQAAGARVSAGLLGAMPVAGVGLGVVVGIDAWQVLLHTPLGALAVGVAVALQLAGLAWAARLATVQVTP